MMKKYLLPVLAILGVVIAIAVIVIDNQSAPPAASAAQAPQAPFAAYVAGAGIIESSTGNIAVGTPVAGIVTAIYVQWGEQVKTGDRLFKIDDRDLQAQLRPALAKVKEAEAKLGQARHQFKLAESIPDPRAISQEEVANRRFAVTIGEAALASAKAQVEQLKLETEQRTIRALVPGQILQIRTRLGEFAPSATTTTPLMVLGNDRQLHVRVDVNENDAWRVRPGAAAVAFVRGNPQLQTPLHFERIEPYVVPKTALTGETTERVDTRVLQVIYSFDPAAFPAYVGQQMDVFIQAAVPESQSGAGSRP